MKNIGKILFFSFLFLVTLFASEVVTVSAKSSSSEVFEVTVGDDKLPIYYELVNTSDGVKEMLKFPVELKGKESVSISYRWEHTFCYKVVGENEVCEVDLTGEDQPVEEGKETVKILGDKIYSYTYFDEDMPYYSETLEFEYITFKNKFVSLDGSNKEIILDDISFLGSEIDYSYKFDVVIETYEKEGTEYVGYNPRGIFVNNGSSNVILNSFPTYQIINSLCISEDKCIGTNYSTVVSNNSYYPITPYIGNLKFPYDSYSNFRDSGAGSVNFKTSVACISNCSDTRRVKGTIEEPLLIYEGSYSLYLDNPVLDVSQSMVSSMDEYKKTKELKISVKDDFSGIDEDSLYYYLAWENSDGSCPTSVSSYSSYAYENGALFEIGSKLNSGKMCMYFEAGSVMGNVYKSDYYHFKFDNTKPGIELSHEYEDANYYNEVILHPTMKDSHSGVKEGYYLWSKEEINLASMIETDGQIYTGEINSLKDLNEDGTYYVYFLVYDNLDNYYARLLGVFNIDTTPLSISDIDVSSDLSDINYNNSGGVTVNVSEMSSGESYKCGFLNKNEVTVLDLNMNCMNGNKISLPSSTNGEYSFYAYVKDRASNYSLFEMKKDIKIDTKSPIVEYSVLFDDNKYRVNNEITINVSDFNELNSNSMKYGWFLANKNNVLSSNLVNSFENNSKIYYPNSYYGEYKLYVSVMDSVGNQTFMALDKIFRIDTDVVRISLVGEDEVTILKGEEYIDLGAKAYKGEIGSNTRTSEVRVSGVVDTNKAGTYYLIYTSGEGQFEVSVTRKVIVKSDAPYLFISVGLFGVGILVTGLRLFVRRKKE